MRSGGPRCRGLPHQKILNGSEYRNAVRPSTQLTNADVSRRMSRWTTWSDPAVFQALRSESNDMRNRFSVRLASVASCFILGLLGVQPSACFAQAFVHRVEPASVTRGEETRVVLHGSRLELATALWISVPEGRVTATRVGESTSDRAVFDIKVPASLPLGFYGLRLATRSGLSNAHIFLVDEIATVPEEEMAVPEGVSPMQAPQVVELPVAIAGSILAEDVDLFAFDAEVGQEVTFEVVGSRLGKGLDPLVTIRDAGGKVIVQRDNDVGLFYDLRFAHKFGDAGRYTVEVRDSRFRGSDHWGYVLRMGRFPQARVAVPATVPAGKATTLTFPQLGALARPEAGRVTPSGVIDGRMLFALKRPGDDLSAWLPLRISPGLSPVIGAKPNERPGRPAWRRFPGPARGDRQAGDVDHFRVSLKKGQLYQVQVETHTIGSPADIELILLDPAGKEVTRADDSGLDEARMNVSPPADGEYILVVKELVNWGGPEFAYAIRFAPRGPPGPTFSSGITRVALPLGTRQPLPLSLNQVALSGDVAFRLKGAPKGITMKINEVKQGTREIDNYLLCDSSTKPGVYTIQVEAVSKANAKVTALASTRPLIDRRPVGRGPHGEPFELREDQRRLPPTLTERIAVVVLPTSPFDFELASPLVTLPRYQTAKVNVKTTRIAGFESPIRFVARGGELDQNNLRKPRVRLHIGEATVGNPTTTGTLESYVNTLAQRQRVILTGTTVYQGRELSLTRTFDIDIVVAFRPGPAQKKVTVAAGSSVRVAVRPNRLAPFDGPVMLSPSGRSRGWSCRNGRGSRGGQGGRG
ncbi:MAG: hypothetical protein Ct9H300mP1_39290 [Planctomycetaceae bacterium]|nr:MAG: hypothetical protein Ct9H300mP1_39290 [Planctomycetaceae bacterium]